MHRSHYFLAQCLSVPWAMTPSAMSVYVAMLVQGYAQREGVAPMAHDYRDADDYSPSAAVAPSKFGRQGDIAVVTVRGVIMQRASQLGDCEEGTGTEQILGALQVAMNDETVGQILIDFDTPGGSVFGVAECGDQIREMAKTKPIIGFANSLCASAGYWLMSQCSECYATPGGQVGSIGVYNAHQDVSKALEAAGLNITLVSAGKYKVEGNPYGPLSDEARANQQEGIDAYYKSFTTAVSKGRRVSIETVRNGMGEGRCLSAAQALAENMIDGVMPFDALIRKMQGSGGRTAPQPRGRSLLAAARNQLAMLS
jgi:signal peptide peptidase SppA